MALSATQQANAARITQYAKSYGATDTEVKQLLSLAWAESKLENVGEMAGTAAKSKAKTGNSGRGVFQYTDPSLMKAHKVTDPFDIQQSTRGALQGLRENRGYWAKRGVGDKDMLSYLVGSWNAGTGRADTALKNFPETKGDNQRAQQFYAGLTGGSVAEFNAAPLAGDPSRTADSQFNLPTSQQSPFSLQPNNFGGVGNGALGGTQQAPYRQAAQLALLPSEAAPRPATQSTFMASLNLGLDGQQPNPLNSKALFRLPSLS